MVKHTLKKYCFVVNILLLAGFVYLISQLISTLRPKLIEGVTDTNCCGGIEAGVHYRETDKNPPEYVRRCFRSQLENGGLVYEWNGFPCTSKESAQCCPDSDGENGGNGECIATSNGGYCKKSDNSKYMFEDGTKRPYFQVRTDKHLDINNVLDMEDYFYERSTDTNLQNLSPEMQQFMARKDENQRYLQQKLIEKNKLDTSARESALDNINNQTKNYQLTYALTTIHVGLLVSIAIFVRPTIVSKIQEYLDIVNIQYLKFSGKV